VSCRPGGVLVPEADGTSPVVEQPPCGQGELGPNPGSAPATPYAAPARAGELSGPPPAHIATAELCPNRAEDITYALRLLQAGVPVELHQWPGAFQGSQAILSADMSQRQIPESGAVLRAPWPAGPTAPPLVQAPLTGLCRRP
jgi:acetyl esterase/lipase